MTKIEKENYLERISDLKDKIDSLQVLSFILFLIVVGLFVWLIIATSDSENVKRILGEGFAKQQCNERNESLVSFGFENSVPTIICTKSNNSIDGINYNIR